MTKNYRVIAALIVSALFFVQQYACAMSDGKGDWISRAKQVTAKYKLSDRTDNCLIYEVLPEKYEDKTVIDVREKHGGACGGDPAVSPRIFSIAFDEKTNEIWSDANSLVGQLEKIGTE